MARPITNFWTLRTAEAERSREVLGGASRTDLLQYLSALESGGRQPRIRHDVNDPSVSCSRWPFCCCRNSLPQGRRNVVHCKQENVVPDARNRVPEWPWPISKLDGTVLPMPRQSASGTPQRRPHVAARNGKERCTTRCGAEKKRKDDASHKVSRSMPRQTPTPLPPLVTVRAVT